MCQLRSECLNREAALPAMWSRRLHAQKLLRQKQSSPPPRVGRPPLPSCRASVVRCRNPDRAWKSHSRSLQSGKKAFMVRFHLYTFVQESSSLHPSSALSCSTSTHQSFPPLRAGASISIQRHHRCSAQDGDVITHALGDENCTDNAASCAGNLNSRAPQMGCSPCSAACVLSQLAMQMVVQLLCAY